MTARELFSETGKGPWMVDAETDTQWSLRDKGNGTYLLVFPPTWNALDWRQNLDFKVAPYRDMPWRWRAHRGFVRKYKAVRDAIGAAIQAANPMRLIVVGFSQGGALATLAFEDIVFNGWAGPRGMAVHGVVFGSPRVVSWFAPAKRWEGFTRVVVRGDIVPAVPPVVFGYKHVGREVKIGPRCFVDPMKHDAYPEYLGELGETW